MRPPEFTANGRPPDLEVPRNRRPPVLNRPDAITPEIALLLEQRFGISAELWMNMRPASVLPPAPDETDT